MNYSKCLLALLSLKAFLIVLFILYGSVGLGPDEAQYWTWSRALDWGYYSKPPGIAWQIWLGTKLFGQTEWGIRSLSVLLATLQAWLIYLLAGRAGLSSRTAFWCSLFMAFSPLGFLGSFLAITDVGFLVCWSGACITVVTALQQNKAPKPVLVGLWVLGGALFKWPIYSFWFFYFVAYFLFFRDQKVSHIIRGVGLSLLGLLPSFWWNVSHDWATFRHVGATIQGGSGEKGAGNFVEFLGSQAFLFSPLLFILLLGGCWYWFRHRKALSPSLFFCGFVTLVCLGSITLASFFQKIQGNWIVFAYPTASVLLGWYAFQTPSRMKWAKGGVVVSICLTSLILIPTLNFSSESSPGRSLFYSLSPFKHNLGWVELSQILTKEGYDPAQHFLVGDKYQTTSLLSFYGKGQKRAYFLNLHGTRKNQFSYWPSLQEEQQGKNGYFIWVENKPRLKRDWQSRLTFYQNELKNYFEEVEFLQLAPLLYEGEEMVKGALLFRCRECKVREFSENNPLY